MGKDKGGGLIVSALERQSSSTEKKTKLRRGAHRWSSLSGDWSFNNSGAAKSVSHIDPNSIDWCCIPPPGGGGGSFMVLANPSRPTHPHQKRFPQGKTKFMKEAGNLTLMSGTRTFFRALIHPPHPPPGGGGGGVTCDHPPIATSPSP